MEFTSENNNITTVKKYSWRSVHMRTKEHNTQHLIMTDPKKEKTCYSGALKDIRKEKNGKGYPGTYKSPEVLHLKSFILLLMRYEKWQ